MPLTKAAGNMYNWITHTHAHLRGACPHHCHYCYVQSIEKHWRSGHHAGPIRLKESELAVNYGHGKTIFIEHTTDLFADAVPDDTIRRILHHCCQYPQNTYVFQTKNPGRMSAAPIPFYFPPNTIFGTTIESDMWHIQMGDAPLPINRSLAMDTIKAFYPYSIRSTFVTVEPIMAFFKTGLAPLIRQCRPDFVNIGADSKHSGLPEPTPDEIRHLIDTLRNAGITVNLKPNLARLLPEDFPGAAK